MPAPAGCQPFEVPPAHVGDEYAYRGTGPLSTVSLGGIPFDPATFGGQGEPGQARMEAGDRLRIAIGDERSRLAMDGSWTQAYQTSLWLERAGGLKAALADEWVAVEDGRLVQAVYRAIYDQAPLGAYHNIRLGRQGWPALLLAPMAWQGPDRLPTGPVALPSEPFGPSAPRIGWTLSFTHSWDPGPCRLRIVADGHYAFPDGFSFEWTFGPDTSLPIRYVQRYQGTTLALELEAAHRGDGPALKPWPGPVPPAESGLPASVDAATFFHAMDGLPTAFSEAEAAVRAEPRSMLWFRSHPEAVAAAVEHQMGEAESGPLDRWTILWTDGEEGLRSLVSRSRPQGLVPSRFEVDSVPESPQPVPTGHWVSWQALGSLHRAVYGKDPEAFSCYLSETMCRVLGPHNATAMPRAGPGGGAGFIHVGLLVGLRDGLVYQIDSIGERPIGPPVSLRPQGQG